MNRVFKYISASALLLASFVTVANAQLTDAEKALIKKSVILDKKTSPGPTEGTYYLNLETFITGYTSNVTTVTTTTTSTPLDIVLLLDVSGSMSTTLSGNQSRIDALKNAVSDFITTIKTNAVQYKADHRISLIKFAGDQFPVGTNLGSRTSYLELTSASYSYTGYGTNSYYFKDGDNYYQVKRETGVGAATYTAQSSKSYKYNSIDNNSHYYYKYGDNYYEVSRGTYNGGFLNTTTYYYLSFTANGTVYYLSGTGVTTTRPSNITKQGTDIWKGVLYTRAQETLYRLYYQDESSVKHYLSGTTTTTTAPTNIKDAASTIWTGVLYNASTTQNVPLNIVEGDNTYTSGSFTYNRTQVVKNFTSVGTGTGADDLITALNKLKERGGTYTNFGMQLAQLVFDEGSRADAIKVLVLFTDGEPGKSGYDKDVADPAVAASHYLKSNLGVKVYTIGTFTNPSNDVTNFMNYTSSNYLDATSMDNHGNSSSNKYYYEVSNATQLSDVFQTISTDSSQEASNANAGYTEATTENNVTVKDIVTNDFVIPADANGDIDLSKIEIFTAKSTGVTRVDDFDYQNYQYTEDGYTWDDLVRSDLEPVASRDSNGKTTVSVPGFDFSANWVGWQDAYESLDGGKTYSRKTGEGDCTLHEGYKLIIKVLVEPDPNTVGGLVPTNDKDSGLYITKDGKEVSLMSYKVPASVLVPMDLEIVMNGVTKEYTVTKDGKTSTWTDKLYKEGETAIFQVTNFDNTKTWTVAVTAGADGKGNASIKVPFYNDATKDKYTVTELPAWSYRFNTEVDTTVEKSIAAGTKSLTKQLTKEDHTFTFVAVDTEDRGDDDIVSRDLESFFYDESNNNNVFDSSANPTSTTTTSRVK